MKDIDLRELTVGRMMAAMRIAKLADSLGFELTSTGGIHGVLVISFRCDPDWGVEEFDNADQLRSWLDGWRRCLDRVGVAYSDGYSAGRMDAELDADDLAGEGE